MVHFCTAYWCTFGLHLTQIWGSNFPLTGNKEDVERFNKTFRFIDLNNDRLIDICYNNKNNSICRLNSGKKFNKAKIWLSLNSSDWPIYYNNRKKEEINDYKWLINKQEGSINFADVDGDGLADFTAIIAEEYYYAKNLGDKFSPLKKLDEIFPDDYIIQKRKNIYANWVKEIFGLSTTIVFYPQ